MTDILEVGCDNVRNVWLRGLHPRAFTQVLTTMVLAAPSACRLLADTLSPSPFLKVIQTYVHTTSWSAWPHGLGNTVKRHVGI